MAARDQLPKGIALQPDEEILRIERFGKRRLVYWLTSKRLIVGQQQGRGTSAQFTLPLEHCASVRSEVRHRFLHRETWMVVQSTGGTALEEEFSGKDAERLGDFCAAVSNAIGMLGSARI